MTTNITLTVSIKVFEWLKKTGSTVNQNHEDTYKTSNIFILYKTLSEVINIRYLKYTKNTQNHHKSLLSKHRDLAALLNISLSPFSHLC